MKKVMMAVLAASLFISAPAFAVPHGGSHDPADVQCAKDCELLLKDCSQEVDSIQQKIRKLEATIKKEGADPQKREYLKVLQLRLAEAKDTLESLERPGR